MKGGGGEECASMTSLETVLCFSSGQGTRKIILAGIHENNMLIIALSHIITEKCIN